VISVFLIKFCLARKNSCEHLQKRFYGVLQKTTILHLPDFLLVDDSDQGHSIKKVQGRKEGSPVGNQTLF